MIKLIVLALANAAGRRFQGGLLGQWLGNIGGTHVGRLVMAAIAGASIAWAAPVWWWGLVAVPALWAGSCFGFPQCGMMPKNTYDVGAIAVRHGLVSVAPLLVVLAVLYPSWGLAWIAAGGLLRGPIYWAACLWQPYCPALGFNPDGLPDPPAWAEPWVGLTLGISIWLAFV